jgi:MFS family permease
MILGAVTFAGGYIWFAVGSHDPVVLVPAFILAGIGIGCAETAQSATVATLAPADLRGSAFGLLATAQAVANLGASAIAGILWSAISPTAAFVFLAATMLMAAPLIASTPKNGRANPG